MCRQNFDRQRDTVLSRLATVGDIGKSYTRRDYLDDLNDWGLSVDEFAASLRPVVSLIVIETAMEAMREVGAQVSQLDRYSDAITAYYEDRSAKIAADVTDETEKQLRATLSAGIKDGETTYQLRARIEAVFGSASTIRADRIARTEVSRAQGFADIEAWSQSGLVSGKEWFTAADERVCAYCGSLDGQTYGLTENIFSKGDSLTIDGKTQHYNYDDVPSAPLHVNCRCTLLPVRS